MYWNGYIKNSVADEMDTYKNGGEKSRKKILTSTAEKTKETTNELSILDDTSIQGVEKHMKKLQTDDLLLRIGGRKEDHWEIL